MKPEVAAWEERPHRGRGSRAAAAAAPGRRERWPRLAWPPSSKGAVAGDRR